MEKKYEITEEMIENYELMTYEIDEEEIDLSLLDEDY